MLLLARNKHNIYTKQHQTIQNNISLKIMKKKIKNNKNSTCIFCMKCGSMNVPKLELLLMLIEEQDYNS